MNNILIHIPHSSYYIPKKYRGLFYLSDEELFCEQLKMTDSFTNELFDNREIQKIVFPISRLLCDVERFRAEKDEEMTKQGMWVCYTKTSELNPLKKMTKKHKREILKNYYDKHHSVFDNFVAKKLKEYGSCVIIDAHSFSSVGLAYELHSQKIRPDICIGTDDFHTPKEITELFYNSFSKLGYKVGINNPFCGSIVPLKYYQKNKNVMSIMIELNRALYMDEKTGEKSSKFELLQRDISQTINLLI